MDVGEKNDIHKSRLIRLAVILSPFLFALIQVTISILVLLIIPGQIGYILAIACFIISEVLVKFVGIKKIGGLTYLSKQFYARGKASEIFDSEKHSILYLRPFENELSYEEELRKALDPIGHMIAIGKPGEKLPPVGAARLYTENARWKNQINSWLEKAELVILCPGTTEGLWWELEQVIKKVDPNRILILINWQKKSEIYQFLIKFENEFNIKLPELILLKKYKGVVMPGFISFRENWSCRFLPLIAPFWCADEKIGMEKAHFNYALKPVFEKVGAEWEPSFPSISKIAIVFGICAALLGLITWIFELMV